MKTNILSESGQKILLYLIAVFVIRFSYNLFLLILDAYPELSGIPYAVTKALIGVITLKAVDELMLYQVPTLKILKENAIAYAIYIAAYALIIALALANA